MAEATDAFKMGMRSLSNQVSSGNPTRVTTAAQLITLALHQLAHNKGHTNTASALSRLRPEIAAVAAAVADTIQPDDDDHRTFLQRVVNELSAAERTRVEPFLALARNVGIAT